MKNFILNVTASIIATISIVLFINYLIPYLRGFFLKTPNVSGKWDVRTPEDQQCKGVLTITQRGIRIKATFLHLDTHSMFHYKGNILSGQLVLNFEEKGKEGLNVGAFILRLQGHSNQMIGRTLFWNNDQGEFNSNEYRATRV